MKNVQKMDFSFIENIQNIGKGKKFYKNAFFAFDIETATDSTKPDEPQNYMYIWQMACKPIGEKAFAWYGRTWESFLQTVKTLSRLAGDAKIKIFVHNLSYEWQFLRSFYKELEVTNLFLLDVRKPCRFTAFGNVEFYCSFMLSNMSLLEFTKKYKVEHEKKEDYDYREQLYPDSELKAEQLQYCENDVLGLCEALEKNNNIHDDTIITMPLTNTGYVRRDIKNNADEILFKIARYCFPDLEVYNMLLAAFRGGNTHANRYKVGEIFNNVHSYDRTSSYPAVQLCRPYPIKPFQKIEKPNVDLMEYFYYSEKPILAKVALWNCEVKPEVTVPYLAKAKCCTIEKGYIDNGRILYADYLETVVTDIDWKILLNQYQIGEMAVISLYVSEYGYLPACFKKVILSYFQQKTLLKGDKTQELYYMKAKNQLNSCYGMTATRPVRPELDYCENDYTETAPDYELELRKAKKSAYLCYQWGVWCTAWARWELQRAIDLCGDNFIYADTDSVKFIGDVDFSELNTHLQKIAVENGAYCTKNGKTYYMGVYEHDAEYKRFRTWGAKKYAYEDETGLHITIAGVNKKDGAKELAEKGGLEVFTPGFIFQKSGGTRAIYNDDVTYYKYTLSGHEVEHTSNTVIADVTYSLGIAKEYEQLLLQLSHNDIVKLVEDIHKTLE